MKHLKFYLFILFTAMYCTAGLQSLAQQADTLSQHIDSSKAAVRPLPPPLSDTAKLAHDDTVKKPKLFQPNPKRAGLYSAIFPGLGQLYNRQYWKIPVVYAIMGAAGYFIVSNQNKYQEYRKAYIGRLTGDFSNETSNTLLYSADQLKTLQDGYKRYLDITVLVTGVAYTLQILDAVVFAHLKNFDVSKDISLHMAPLALPNGSPSMGLVFNIKPSRHVRAKEVFKPF
ncbi:MAG: hypothetical protein JSS82_11780 [Bacteroidetes bacterium]|nr:hypothetical protein [Bacteroidota bacterium]